MAQPNSTSPYQLHIPHFNVFFNAPTAGMTVLLVPDGTDVTLTREGLVATPAAETGGGGFGAVPWGCASHFDLRYLWSVGKKVVALAFKQFFNDNVVELMNL